MNAVYDITKPRVSVTSPMCPESYEQSTRELGQGTLWGEVCFWLSLGYTAEFAEWNGKVFATHQTFTQADL
jgi:hypothetical protein